MKSKAKGSIGERKAKKWLEEGLSLAPGTLSRNLEQSRSGGSDILGLGPLTIEVKRRKRGPREYERAAWLEQVVRAAPMDTTPVVLYKVDGRNPWRVIVLATVNTMHFSAPVVPADILGEDWLEALQCEPWLQSMRQPK